MFSFLVFPACVTLLVKIQFYYEFSWNVTGFALSTFYPYLKLKEGVSHGCRSVLMLLSSSTIGIRKRPVTAKKEQWKWLDSVHRACDSVTSSLNDNLSPESHGPIECPTNIICPRCLYARLWFAYVLVPSLLFDKKIYDVTGFKFFSQRVQPF